MGTKGVRMLKNTGVFKYQKRWKPITIYAESKKELEFATESFRKYGYEYAEDWVWLSRKRYEGRKEIETFALAIPVKEYKRIDDKYKIRTKDDEELPL
jgi:hypothetical protein